MPPSFLIAFFAFPHTISLGVEIADEKDDDRCPVLFGGCLSAWRSMSQERRFMAAKYHLFA